MEFTGWDLAPLLTRTQFLAERDRAPKKTPFCNTHLAPRWQPARTHLEPSWNRVGATLQTANRFRDRTMTCL